MNSLNVLELLKYLVLTLLNKNLGISLWQFGSSQNTKSYNAILTAHKAMQSYMLINSSVPCASIDLTRGFFQTSSNILIF